MAKVKKVTIKEVKAGKASETFENKDLHTTDSEENIIVIGTQQFNHDFLGYVKAGFDAGINGKFMFIHQAMRKIKLNTELDWTIITFKEGYTEDQLSAMKVAILAYYPVGVTVNFIDIGRYHQLLAYINTGDANGSDRAETSEERKLTKIRRMHFFCHGLVNRLAIGITNISTADDMLDITHQVVDYMHKESFSSDAIIYCWSCRTGLGNPKIDESVYYEESVSTGIFTSKKVRKQYNLYSAQSLAQKLADATGATVYAYLRRSEYSDTLNTAEELDFKDAYEAGLYGKKHERKNKRYDYLLDNKKATAADREKYRLLSEEEKGRRKVGKAWFDPQGAKYPVRAGVRPEGLPDDMKTFKTLKK